MDILSGMFLLIIYYLVFLLIILCLTQVRNLPKEFIRKSYHIMCALGNVILIEMFDHWLSPFIIHLVLFSFAYIGITLFSKTRLITSLYIDRFQGTKEIRKQIIYFTAAFSISVGLFWGVLGNESKGVVSIGFIAWGVGDTAAALIGKYYGTVQLKKILPFFNPQKSLEGTVSLIASTLIVTILSIHYYYEAAFFWHNNLGLVLVSLCVALIAGITEGMSFKGIDTITLPLSVMLISYLLIVF